MTNQLRRIFFALWPDDKTRLSLENALNLSVFSQQAECNLQSYNLHMTLHFLGNVPEDQFDCVLSVAKKVKANAFNMILNEFGVFKPAKVFYMGMSKMPEELIYLHRVLGDGLQTCHYQPELRSFTPHVTFKRKINQFDIQCQPEVINWRVKQFFLIEAVSGDEGVLYKPIKFSNLI